MIATILRQEPKDARTRVDAWRQLSDILAQRGDQLDNDDASRALHALAFLRPHIGEAVRRASAFAIARRCRFAPLVAFYAADTQPVAEAMLRDVMLSEGDWLAFLPTSSAVARAVLHRRTDLAPRVVRALDALGARSVALPGPPVVQTETDFAETAATGDMPDEEAVANDTSGTSQISELVRRIDRYRETRSPEAINPQADRNAFLFETGPDGIVRWVAGATRGAVIGLSIADAAFGGEPGTDGLAAGAFRQRAEIINARMVLEGTLDVAGEWRFSALPWFDAVTGQFRGYRGSARRPRRNEIPYGQAQSTPEGDSIRQLIHELRSPLNAISGFAQIIAGQMFGPVSQTYRQMAGDVIADAATIQSLIDDLDTTARGVTSAQPVDGQGEWIDMGLIVGLIERELADLLASQGQALTITHVGGPFRARVDGAAARRMVGRLLTALADVAQPGERLSGQLIFDAAAPDLVLLRIARPERIRTVPASELLDPGYSPNGDAPGAALLSLGFSMRLVTSLARSAGGDLDIGHSALTLRLHSANSLEQPGQQVKEGDQPV